jgi:hypothetical protein
MDCPCCGLVNSESALRCDCGYDFHTKEIKKSYLFGSESEDPPPDGKDNLRKTEGIIFKKNTKRDFKIILSLFIIIIFLGYFGYMISKFIPSNEVYFWSFWLSLLIGIYFLYRFYKSHPDYKSYNTLKSIGFGFVICPVTLFLLWVTFTYTIPAFLSRFSRLPYEKEHTVMSKKVNCSKSRCHHWLRLNGLNPIMKSGTKVTKSFYKKTYEGDKIIVQGYQSVFGIEPIKLIQIKEKV